MDEPMDSTNSVAFTPRKFRYKPVVVEAVKWDGNSNTANAFLGDSYGVDWVYVLGSPAIVIRVNGTKVEVDVGDWIIKGVKGEFYPCKPDIFAEYYEPLDQSFIKGQFR